MKVKKLSEITGNRWDGVVLKASALLSVDLGLIFQVESYQRTSKNGVYSFSAWCSAQKGSSWSVVSLGKTLNGMLPFCMWQKGGEAKQSTRPGAQV